jgi:hypothetical protein
MADVNERKTDFEMDIQPEESCEGCEVPVTNTCQSCGMPMMSPEHHGGGDEDNDYCIQCCHPDGILKNYDDVLEQTVGLMMNNRGMDRAAAEYAAREYLATMPAWGHR